MRNQEKIDRRNFPRSEYELVRASDPKTLHRLSPGRLNQHIQRCERLIDGYSIRLKRKSSLRHVWRGSESLGSTRLIRYRINHLSMSLRKFRSELRKGASSPYSVRAARKGTASKQAAKSSRGEGSHSITSQPKMKISRHHNGGGAAQVRERQRRAAVPENSVNPSVRSR